MAPDARVVLNMGDNERFDDMYRFGTTRPCIPGDRSNNPSLLDEGTLYMAKLNAKGTSNQSLTNEPLVVALFLAYWVDKYMFTTYYVPAIRRPKHGYSANPRGECIRKQPRSSH